MSFQLNSQLPKLSYLNAPCHIFLLPVNCCLSFVGLILPKGLEGLDFQYFQSIPVQHIHVIDSSYLKSEYALLLIMKKSLETVFNEKSDMGFLIR